jgi:hypothetical protein
MEKLKCSIFGGPAGQFLDEAEAMTSGSVY